MQRIGFFILALLVGLGALAGCAKTKIDIEPEKVHVTQRKASDALHCGEDCAEDKPIDLSLPPEMLFQKGYNTYQAGDKETALLYFVAIVQYHEKAPAFADSAYNAGLIFEKQQKWEKAIEMFQLVQKHAKANGDKIDAGFRMLPCMQRLKDWKAMQEQITYLENNFFTKLSEDDKVDILARKGIIAFYTNEDLIEVEKKLRYAMDMYEIGVRKGEVVLETAGAMASYYLGLVERKRFDKVRLIIADETKMLTSMEEKASHLFAAQRHFLKSIRQDNAYWATASGFEIGKLYRDFYIEMQNSETPDKIQGDKEAIEMYRCKVSERVRVLLRKAMRIFDRNIQIGQRLRVRNRWIEKTEADLEAVQKLYLEEIKKCEGVLPTEEDMKLLEKKGKPKS